MVCLGLIVLLFYSYYSKFSYFWRILLVFSCGSFLFSYLKVALSRPGVAHPRREATALDREDRRFCHFCGLVR
jgi:hypothetical protein